MVANSREEWSNPVVGFVEHPVMFTGTGWKFKNLSDEWQRLLTEKQWRTSEISDMLGLAVISHTAEQLAIPKVIEPNEMIRQEALVTGKAENQVKALGRVLADPESASDPEVIVPDWIRARYAQGLPVQVVFVNTDVGRRDIDGPGKQWVARRNLYLDEHLQKQHHEGELIKHVLEYWTNEYGDVQGGPVRLVADSAMAMTQVVYKRNNGSPHSRIFPAQSTVGIRMDEQILASPEGRQAAVDFLYEQYKDDPRVREKHLSPLAVLHNRAGGFKLEDAHKLALARGIHSEIFAHGHTDSEKHTGFVRHVEAVPYSLFRALILTLATAHDPEMHNIKGKASSGLRYYPPGKKDLLRL